MNCLEVEVEYDNHVGCFVFWNKDCIPFVQMTATVLRQIMKKAGEDNPKIYSAHLDKLLNKELAFRIKYPSFFQQYSIVKGVHFKNFDPMIGFLS
ncbi:unnamed protein product [Lathyrus sativus]|nr:unnamed protein product [Lathyrus sativus]